MDCWRSVGEKKHQEKIKMTPKQYTKEVRKLGGPVAVAALVGVTAANIRKRMSGVCPVDLEAEIAVKCRCLEAEICEIRGNPKKTGLK